MTGKVTKRTTNKAGLWLLLLIVGAIVMLMPLTAFAAENDSDETGSNDIEVARIGETTYRTLSEAMRVANNATQDTTVTVIRDFKTNNLKDIRVWVINEKATITLDLNGHSITYLSGESVAVAQNLMGVNPGARFVLKGPGTIHSQLSDLRSRSAMFNNRGTATISGVTFDRMSEGNGYAIINQGEMTIAPGTTITKTPNWQRDTNYVIKNGYESVDQRYGAAEPKLTIDGLESKYGIANYSNGHLTINGGTISRSISNSADLVINGGTFEGYLERASGNITINGGKFAASPQFVSLYDDTSAAEDTGNITINSGDFTNVSKLIRDKDVNKFKPGTHFVIHGGTFQTKALFDATQKDVFNVTGKTYVSDPFVIVLKEGDDTPSVTGAKAADTKQTATQDGKTQQPAQASKTSATSAKKTAKPNQQKADGVKTGDDTQAALWGVVMLSAGAGILAMMLYRRRRQS